MQIAVGFITVSDVAALGATVTFVALSITCAREYCKRLQKFCELFLVVDP